MTGLNFHKGPARCTLRVLAAVAALTVAACDNDINFNPTTPAFRFPVTSSDSALAPERSLQIVGSLTAEQGSCLEATVLYDGHELEGARAACPRAGECNELELSAVVETDTGRHTISFQVLRQSRDTVSYSAEGTVRISREGLPTFLATLPLGPTRTRLRTGESVTFEVAFWN